VSGRLSTIGQRSGTRWNLLALCADGFTLPYALVRSGELPAIKVGGRGQWRVESAVLEEYIARMYEQTRTFIESNPVEPDQSMSES